MVKKVMKIIEVPQNFQPTYYSTYPPYSSGKNTEEICFDILKHKVDEIDTEYIYIPIFWTTIYTMRNHEGSFDDLYDWLDTIDKSKKYFTVVQNDCGVFVRNFNLNILVFSAGGGGLNIKNAVTIKNMNYYGVNRSVFAGNKGDYDIPLMCLPLLEENLNNTRDIFCSFMGRYDTHWCRFRMAETLKDLPEYKFFQPTSDIGIYKEVLNRSIFTLSPRGFGYTSFRMFEAILSGSIPIYVWEDKCALPFEDVLHWSQFAIVININEITNLPNILKGVDIKKMQDKVQSVKKFFNYEYIAEYIKQHIQ
jgi:hypothetical protein